MAAVNSSKKILIMRHAKSSHAGRNMQDFDRPLNKRGKQDAPRMGRYLLDIGLLPDQIISSTAARAKATTLAVAGEINFREKEIDWADSLYHGGPKDYMDAIRSANETSDIVMTVGHNPMTEWVIESLVNGRVTKSIVTATIACFESGAANWKEVDPETCKLLWITSPEDLVE